MNRDEWRRRCLPYGKWTCGDGREVLFNRMHWPILERPSPSAPARPADPNEWVSWIEQEYFFNDASSPWAARFPKTARETLVRLHAILGEWGYPVVPPLQREPRGRARSWFKPPPLPRRNPYASPVVT